MPSAKRLRRRRNLSTPAVFAYIVDALEQRGEMSIKELLDFWSGDVNAAQMHAHLQAMENRGYAGITDRSGVRVDIAQSLYPSGFEAGEGVVLEGGVSREGLQIL